MTEAAAPADNRTAGAAAALLRQRFQLARHINDDRAGSVATGEGVAWFCATGDADRLIYCEEGLLNLADSPAIRFERRYHWHLRGLSVQVCFEDGRPFHGFRLFDLTETIRHDCGADLYLGRCDMRDAPARWSTDWEVTGPRKSYRARTEYRLDPPPDPAPKPLAKGARIGHSDGETGQ